VTAKVLTCTEFDAQGTCVSEVWADVPDATGGLLTLSVADAEAIAWAVVYVWAIGMIFRLAKKSLD